MEKYVVCQEQWASCNGIDLCSKFVKICKDLA